MDTASGAGQSVEPGRRCLCRNEVTVFHDGMSGVGLATAHPEAVVDRTVAPSRCGDLGLAGKDRSKNRSGGVNLG